MAEPESLAAKLAPVTYGEEIQIHDCMNEMRTEVIV